MPPGTHDYSNISLRNATICGGSASRSEQIRTASFVKFIKSHVQVCIHSFIFGCYVEAVVKQQFQFAWWFITYYYRRKNNDVSVDAEAKSTNNLIFFQKSVCEVLKIRAEGCIRHAFKTLIIGIN